MVLSFEREEGWEEGKNRNFKLGINLIRNIVPQVLGGVLAFVLDGLPEIWVLQLHVLIERVF